MNIITCLPIENNEYISRKNKKYFNIFAKTRISFRAFIFIAAISFTVILFLSAPFFIGNFTFSSIKAVHFWDDPSVKNAMYEYSIKSGTFNTNTNFENAEITETGNTATEDFSGLTEIPDFIPAVNFETYTVAKGDTLGGITYKFGLKNIGTLISINEISNVKRLKAGDKLNIPSIDGIFYTALKGDSISSIAAKFNLPVTAILDANDLENEIITVNQKLFIPGATISKFELKKAMGELFIYPLIGRFTSPFGTRHDPFTGRASFHTGIDIAAPSGTAIKATLDGSVSYTGVSSIYGNYIIISHGGGYQTMYGHLSVITVKRGQTVNQGEIIGRVGNTGRSTGPHLHFSVYKNGKLINPLSVLK